MCRKVGVVRPAKAGVFEEKESVSKVIIQSYAYEFEVPVKSRKYFGTGGYPLRKYPYPAIPISQRFPDGSSGTTILQGFFDGRPDCHGAHCFRHYAGQLASEK